jgi:cytochrome c553
MHAPSEARISRWCVSEGASVHRSVITYYLAMESIFDLPAHPLMVHLPVVAIPVLALLAILLVVRPSMRSSWRWAAIGLGVVTAVSTILAASSGEALAEVLEAGDYIDDHESLGETLRIFVVGLAASLSALVVFARDEVSAKRPIGTGLSAITLVFALLATVWTIRTGHAGADASWGGVITADENEAEEADEEDEDEDEEADEDEVAAAALTTTQAPEETSSTTSSSTTTSSTTDAPAGVLDGVLEGVLVGKQLYEANCSRCHGSDGKGTRGPSLIGLAAENPQVQAEIDQIINGGQRMPSFGDKLSEAEILAIVGYYRATFVEAVDG